MGGVRLPQNPTCLNLVSLTCSKGTTSLQAELGFSRYQSLLRPLHQQPRPGTTNPSSTITDSRRSGWRICVFHRPRLSSRLSFLSFFFSHHKKRADTMSSSFEPVVSKTINTVVPSCLHRRSWEVLEDGNAWLSETVRAGISNCIKRKTPKPRLSIEFGILYHVPVALPACLAPRAFVEITLVVGRAAIV